MSNNIAHIEQILEFTTEAEATGALMASISWSYAFSLAMTSAALVRIDDPQDPRTKRMSLETIDQRRETLEFRASELADILAWAASYASPDFVPSGADVVRRIEEQDNSTQVDEVKAQEVADLLGLTLEEVRTAAESDAKQQAEERALQQAAVASHRAQIAHILDSAVGAHCSPDLEIKDQDAQRILERIAEKCEAYEGNKVTQAMRTRRRKRVAQLAADRKLLQRAMNMADEAVDKIAEAEESKADAALAGDTVA